MAKYAVVVTRSQTGESDSYGNWKDSETLLSYRVDVLNVTALVEFLGENSGYGDEVKSDA